MAKAKFVSPKGTANWPWFNKPDTRFDAEGKYKTDLLVPKGEASDLMSKAKSLFIEEFGESELKKAKYPFNIEGDVVTLKAKSKQKPVIYDAKGKKINDEVNVGNGSTIKVSGMLGTYDAGGSKGVTAYLNAVQLIDLVEFGGAEFEEEDGYVHVSKEEEFNEESTEDF